MIDPNEPRITSYVLGELSASEAAEIEQAMQSSPELEAAVEEIRSTAGLLGVTGYLMQLDRRGALDVGPIDDVNVFVQLGDRHRLAGLVAPRSSGTLHLNPNLWQQGTDIGE